MQKARGKRQRPKLSEFHEKMAIEDIGPSEPYIEKVHFNGGYFVSSEDERLSFDDVIFKHVRFTNGDMHGAEFVDVVFDTCDFSNVQFQHAVFHRCEFRN